MKSIMLWLLLLAVLAPAPVLADRLAAEEVEKIRANIAQARKVLADPKVDLDPEDRERLRKALAATEKSFQSYLAAVQKEDAEGGNGQLSSSARTGALYAAAGAIAADDATGVGIADDILLPFIVLGLMSTQAQQELAAVASPTNMAIDGLRLSLSVLLSVTYQVAAKKPGCYCKCLYKGTGPLLKDRQPSARACQKACQADRTNPDGYVCDKIVGWFR